MKTSNLICLCALLFTHVCYAAEWDAKQTFVTAGVGYASISTDSFETGPLLSLAGGFNVPLLVEQHLRATTALQLNYIPTVPTAEEGMFGGNFMSAGVSGVLEHDLIMGDKKIWLGAGIQGSMSFVSNQFQWQKNGSVLKAIATPSTIALSAEFLAKIEVPINQRMSFVVAGQLAPLSDSFSAISGQLSIQY